MPALYIRGKKYSGSIDSEARIVQDVVNDPASIPSSAVVYGIQKTIEKTGAQPNVIETIKVNGDILTPDSNKAVNVVTPTTETIKTQIENYGYQNFDQVKKAIGTALADITGIDIKVVTELPETGEKGVVYLIADTHSDENDYFDEYIWVPDESKYEKIGNTDVNLDTYFPISPIRFDLNTCTKFGWYINSPTHGGSPVEVEGSPNDTDSGLDGYRLSYDGFSLLVMPRYANSSAATWDPTTPDDNLLRWDPTDYSQVVQVLFPVCTYPKIYYRTGNVSNKWNDWNSFDASDTASQSDVDSLTAGINTINTNLNTLGTDVYEAFGYIDEEFVHQDDLEEISETDLETLWYNA